VSGVRFLHTWVEAFIREFPRRRDRQGGSAVGPARACHPKHRACITVADGSGNVVDVTIPMHQLADCAGPPNGERGASRHQLDVDQVLGVRRKLVCHLRLSRTPVPVDRHAGDAGRRVPGLHGQLTRGGSSANLMALAMAREAKATTPTRPARLLSSSTSSEAPHGDREGGRAPRCRPRQPPIDRWTTIYASGLTRCGA
jgi:hypothetical protein